MSILIGIRTNLKLIVPYYVLSAYLFFGVLYSAASSYGLWKSFLFFFYFVLLGLSILSSLKDIRSIKAIIYGLTIGCALSLLFSIQVLGNPFNNLSSWGRFERMSLGESNPIIWSQSLGVGIICYAWLLYQSKKFYYIIYVPLIVLTIAYMFLSGSKGPLLALFMTFLISSFFFKRVAFYYMLIISTVIYSFNYILSSYLPYDFLIQRYNISGSGSVSSRLYVYKITLDAYSNFDFLGLLFGAGTGSFAFHFGGHDVRHYPHNVFVEILYEGGMVGATLYLVCLFVPIFAAIRLFNLGQYARLNKVNSELIAISFTLYLYSIFVAQTTGDIGSNWLISFFGFILLSTCLVCSRIHMDSQYLQLNRP